MNNTRKFTILDYPQNGQNKGSYSGKSPSVVANKVFNKLCKDLNFFDNEGGTKYLVFYLKDLESGKVYPFIGTPVILQNPIEIDYQNKQLTVTHRNVVAKYDKNMEEVFKKNIH